MAIKYYLYLTIMLFPLNLTAYNETHPSGWFPLNLPNIRLKRVELSTRFVVALTQSYIFLLFPVFESRLQFFHV